MFQLAIYLFLVVFFSDQEKVYVKRLSIPTGGYLSFQEFIQGNPSTKYCFQITKHVKGDVVSPGAINDYKISCKDKSISKSIIIFQMWGVFDGDTLYLNTYPFTHVTGYTKVEYLGRYSYFWSSMSLAEISSESVYLNAIPFGSVSLSRMRYLHVIDLETGDIKELNKSSIEEILTRYPSLLSEYQNERNNQGKRVLLLYLSKASLADLNEN